MLSIDGRSQYGRLQGGNFSMQDEIQVLKIIYAAASDMSNSNMWQLRALLKSPNQDTVRVLSYIHTSDLDARPHITLLYTGDPQAIIHILAQFDGQGRWTYTGMDSARDTRSPRTLKSPKHLTWDSLETFATLG